MNRATAKNNIRVGWLIVILLVCDLNVGPIAGESVAVDQPFIDAFGEILYWIESSYVDSLSQEDLLGYAAEGVQWETLKHGAQIEPLIHSWRTTFQNTSRMSDDIFLSHLSDLVTQVAHQTNISSETLFFGAMHAMIERLDPFSHLIPPEYWNEMQAGMKYGIGIRIKRNGQRQITIVDVAPNSPAAKAGIQTGDTILKIDNLPIEYFYFKEASERMRGTNSYQVSLTVQQGVVEQEYHLTVSDYFIDPPDVKFSTIDKNIVYLQITHAYADTNDMMAEVKHGLKELELQAATTLIIDARNWSRVRLDAAVKLASLFLEHGSVIFSTKERNRRVHLQFTSSSGQYADLSIIVLINESTSRYAEIFAGALQAHSRAVVIGTPSEGNGGIWNTIPLETYNMAIILKVAEMLTPNSHPIEKNGIVPDIVLLSQKNRLDVLENKSEACQKNLCLAVNSFEKEEILSLIQKILKQASSSAISDVLRAAYQISAEE